MIRLVIAAIVLLGLTGCGNIANESHFAADNVVSTSTLKHIVPSSSASVVDIATYATKFNTYVEEQFGFAKYQLSLKLVKTWNDKQTVNTRLNNATNLRLMLDSGGKVFASSLVGTELKTNDFLDDRFILQNAMLYASGANVQDINADLINNLSLDFDGTSSTHSTWDQLKVYEAILPGVPLDTINTYFVILPEGKDLS